VGKSANPKKCRWCGRAIDLRQGPGRPPEYCRPSHRQRDYEARQRAAELGLSESDLVIARQAIHQLQDRIYMLECAIEDVERDLADDRSPEAVHRALNWLLDAARPLVLERPFSER